MKIDNARKVTAATVPNFSHLSAAELQKFIDGISAELKLPGLPFGERIAMNEDRRAARDELARRT